MTSIVFRGLNTKGPNTKCEYTFYLWYLLTYTLVHPGHNLGSVRWKCEDVQDIIHLQTES
jgi:hypothetical protein